MKPHEFIPKETYHSILESLVNFFKNSNFMIFFGISLLGRKLFIAEYHVAAVCESAENSRILARYLTELLFSKNDGTKIEKNKKTAQKRSKAGASILSAVSRHRKPLKC